MAREPDLGDTVRLSFKPAAAVLISAILSISALAVPSLAASAAPRATAQTAYAPSADYTIKQAIIRARLAPGTYVVRRGDTLSAIAARYHLKWEGLYWANRHIIGGNPDNIIPGVRLVLRMEAGYKPPVRAVTTGVIVRNSARHAVTRYAGVYSFSGLEALWVSAGGPPGVKWAAASIAECESGGRPWAYNPSGASGIWQILGAPRGWTGSTNWFDPWVNALAAVTKYRQAGGFSPWVCRA